MHSFGINADLCTFHEKPEREGAPHTLILNHLIRLNMFSAPFFEETGIFLRHNNLAAIGKITHKVINNFCG